MEIQPDGAIKTGTTTETTVTPCVETPTAKETSRPEATLAQQNSIAENVDTTNDTANFSQSIDRMSSVDADSLTVPLQSPTSEDPPSQAVDSLAKDYVNSQGVRFISTESTGAQDSHGHTHLPYGLPCVRELLRFLVSLINPMERQNSEAMIHVGLRLLTIAVETAADVIAAVPSLLILIQDETCRSLFSLLNSERLSVVAAACRLCFLLFEAARTRLKFQLETYLLKLVEIVAHESPKVAYERRLVALESMAQLFRIPGIYVLIISMQR